MIFVFGSNLAGRHGAGAARHAAQYYAAKNGEGEGLTGNSYAIPTKGHRLEVLPLDKIKASVNTFIEYAKANQDMQFMVTRIGCGLAGYADKDISPMFNDAPANCRLPGIWNKREDRRHYIAVVHDGVVPDYLESHLVNNKNTVLVLEESQANQALMALAEKCAIDVMIMLPQESRYGKFAGQSRRSTISWIAEEVWAVGDVDGHPMLDEASSGSVPIIKITDVKLEELKNFVEKSNSLKF